MPQSSRVAPGLKMMPAPMPPKRKLPMLAPGTFRCSAKMSEALCCVAPGPLRLGAHGLPPSSHPSVMCTRIPASARAPSLLHSYVKGERWKRAFSSAARLLYGGGGGGGGDGNGDGGGDGEVGGDGGAGGGFGGGGDSEKGASGCMVEEQVRVRRAEAVRFEEGGVGGGRVEEAVDRVGRFCASPRRRR